MQIPGTAQHIPSAPELYAPQYGEQDRLIKFLLQGDISGGGIIFAQMI